MECSAMKRLALSLLCLVAAPMASASPELAHSWSAKAGDLYLQTAEHMRGAKHGGKHSLDAGYVVELERFAYTASRLGAWNDAESGAKDLGCIFRGMAEDVEVQLDALIDAPAPRDKITALKRLSALLDDAQQIGPAAASAAKHAKTGTHAPAACPANPMLKIRY